MVVQVVGGVEQAVLENMVAVAVVLVVILALAPSIGQAVMEDRG